MKQEDIDDTKMSWIFLAEHSIRYPEMKTRGRDLLKRIRIRVIQRLPVEEIDKVIRLASKRIACKYQM